MTLRFFLSIMIFSSLAGGALTQPLPNTPLASLQAAQTALQRGQTEETQKDLEQARTQILASHTSDDPAVTRVALALKALAAKNRAECARMIEEAMRWVVPATDDWHQRSSTPGEETTEQVAYHDSDQR